MLVRPKIPILFNNGKYAREENEMILTLHNFSAIYSYFYVIDQICMPNMG